MAKLANLNTNGEGVDNITQKVNQLRVQDGANRGRGGRGRGAPRGGRRDGPTKTVELPKEDFDFESSNAKFNKQDLLKEAIASGSPISSPPHGTTPDPLTSVTNGNDNDHADVVIPAKPAAEKSYDKKSSFFDNISSDLKDRTEQMRGHEQIDGRMMRREERTKNVETFGQGSVDGGFRGRGRGRGGRGGFSRGGGRGYQGGRGGPGTGYENRSSFRGGHETAPA
jgi:protein LSM14